MCKAVEKGFAWAGIMGFRQYDRRDAKKRIGNQIVDFVFGLPGLESGLCGKKAEDGANFDL